MTETVARTLGATRRYGEVVALDHVSIDIGSGELVACSGRTAPARAH